MCECLAHPNPEVAHIADHALEIAVVRARAACPVRAALAHALAPPPQDYDRCYGEGQVLAQVRARRFELHNHEFLALLDAEAHEEELDEGSYASKYDHVAAARAADAAEELGEVRPHALPHSLPATLARKAGAGSVHLVLMSAPRRSPRVTWISGTCTCTWAPGGRTWRWTWRHWMRQTGMMTARKACRRRIGGRLARRAMQAST